MSETNHTFKEMLACGFTARMAREYLNTFDRECGNDMFDPSYRMWAHKNGFSAESAYAYNLNENNISRFLSDYDYARLWPLNDWERIWINDKLTLNALVQDSDLARFIPTYYYYSTHTQLLPLKGSDYAPGLEGFLSCLRSRGEFACKPSNGSTSLGFHHLEWRDGTFLIDGTCVQEEDVEQFIAQHPNYVFTEFIRPAKGLAAINPLIHTIRVLVINPTGINPTPTAGYLRFALDDGTSGTGKNYVAPTSKEIGSYNVEIDLQTGIFGNGKLVYGNRVESAPIHPTSGVPAKGTLPHWKELLEMLERLSYKVGACEYLGFDACITDKGPMIMEINSHTGIKYLQLFQPIMDNEILASYYSKKLKELDALDAEAIQRRNAILR